MGEAWLSVTKRLCTGCLSCALACSVGKLGLSAPHRARVRVLREPFMEKEEPLVCRQCPKAPCAKACPTGALIKDGRGAIELRPWLCDGCGGLYPCAEACPFEAMWPSPGGGIIVCDLCPERDAPLCARACPTGAIAHKEKS